MNEIIFIVLGIVIYIIFTKKETKKQKFNYSRKPTTNNQKAIKNAEYNFYKSKQKTNKGEEYEKYVGKHYENKGYSVIYNGIEKGKKDNSVDLIAIKADDILLIQCKNWNINNKYRINHKDIKAFITDTNIFIKDNPIYKEYFIYRIFAISDRILDSSAIKFIKENKNLISYQLLRIDS